MGPSVPQLVEPREHNWSSHTEEEWEWRQLALQWRAIEVVPVERIGEKGEILHNLVSEQKRGRLCSNTAHLNKSVKKMPLRMESLRNVRQRFTKGQWMFKIDIAKFYWSLQIKSSHRKYFRFRMDGVMWQWRALPFGFKNSMQVMDRLMKVVIMKLSKWGIEVLIWVDDIVLLLGQDRRKAEDDAARVLELLFKLGFLVNQEKTGDRVTQIVEFRGFVWDTQNFLVYAPDSKLFDIRVKAKMLCTQRCSARQIASLVGSVRYIAEIHRHLIAWITELEIEKARRIRVEGWDVLLPLPEGAVEEIEHWRSRDLVIKMPIRYEMSKLCEAMGDAGPFGYGFEGFGDHAGLWTAEQREESSNWRELMTWRFEVLEYKDHLRGTISKYGTDSTNAKAYINKIYGRTPKLARISAQTWKEMEEAGMTQIAILKSQRQIAYSDNLSRLVREDEAVLDQEAFQFVCDRLQVEPTVDVFATRFSAKLDRFCSKMQDNQAWAVDAFAFPWAGEVIYAFPPEQLIDRVLARIEEEGVEAMVVAPVDPHYQWYFKLRNLADDWTFLPPQAIKMLVSGTLARQCRWICCVIRGI